MTNTLEDEVRRIVASMDNEEPNDKEQQAPRDTEQEPEPNETIHIHYFQDAIVILKEDADTAQVVDSVSVTPQKISFIPAYAVGIFYLFLIFSFIAFQIYIILNPPIATVTIIPKVQTVTLTGTLQLGRVLQPFTISQSQPIQTTGKGHQDAKQATGFITFYNGQLNSVTVAAGTILAGSDGVQIVTDQDANIPAESQTIPPTLGHTTISAHALIPGTKGNIPTGDINQGCCDPSILAQNTASFHGGQDKRDFSTVSRQDINKLSTLLIPTLNQSMQGALQEQVQPPEQLFILPCTPTQTADHPIGAEATQVKVTVSETCSAVAYNRDALERKATDLLTRQAAAKIEIGYSLFGEVQVTVTQATATHTTTPLVFLSFHAQGTWIYGLSYTVQEQIKKLIAGKSKQESLHLLASLPGIEHASIAWGDDTKLPKNVQNIHLNILVQNF
jgi:hypothetical protein